MAVAITVTVVVKLPVQFSYRYSSCYGSCSSKVTVGEWEAKVKETDRSRVRETFRPSNRAHGALVQQLNPHVSCACNAHAR